LKVKENVLEQAFPFLNQIKEIREGSFVNLGVGEVGFQDSALFVCKYFAYHSSNFSGGKHKTFPEMEMVVVVNFLCSAVVLRFDIYGEIPCLYLLYDRNFLF
jgi:hypothetical protein